LDIEGDRPFVISSFYTHSLSPLDFYFCDCFNHWSKRLIGFVSFFPTQKFLIGVFNYLLPEILRSFYFVYSNVCAFFFDVDAMKRFNWFFIDNRYKTVNHISSLMKSPFARGDCIIPVEISVYWRRWGTCGLNYLIGCTFSTECVIQKMSNFICIRIGEMSVRFCFVLHRLDLLADCDAAMQYNLYRVVIFRFF